MCIHINLSNIAHIKHRLWLSDIDTERFAHICCYSEKLFKAWLYLKFQKERNGFKPKQTEI